MEEKITIIEENIKIIENPSSKKDTDRLVGAIILAGAIIAGAIIFSRGGGPLPVQNQPGGNCNPPGGAPSVPIGKIELNPVTSNEHIFGNPNAKIMIVEYSDTECPFCKRFHVTMHQVVEKYNGKVAWVYRHYPLPMHPPAIKEAEATECAAELGGNTAFWKYVDRLFEITPGNNGLDPAELPKIAAYIGLDVSAFNTCLSSGKYKTLIEKSIAEGSKAGVSGTPGSFLLKNGKVIESITGAQPLEQIIQKIDAALK